MKVKSWRVHFHGESAALSEKLIYMEKDILDKSESHLVDILQWYFAIYFHNQVAESYHPVEI